MKVPFSVYDFFGYLAAGFVCLAAVDYAFSGGWLFTTTPALVPGIALVFIAYVVGHAVSHVAWTILEEWFVRVVLRSPEETMFEQESKTRWARIFPGFFRLLPQETRAAVLKASEKHGIKKPGRGLFYHCHSIAIRDEATRERLAAFLILYGFARNLVVASLFAAFILLIGSFRSMFAKPLTFHWDALLWSLAAIAVAAIMLFRYLKFFRHYTSEVFRSYAASQAGQEP